MELCIMRLWMFLIAFPIIRCFICTQKWPDHCPSNATTRIPHPSDASRPRCTPYAPPLPEGTNWVEIRKKLSEAIFGGLLPTRSNPNYIMPDPGYDNVFGNCLCATLGHCTPAQCSRPNNMTRFVWTMTAKVNDSYTIRLNSTVHYTLNTSGVAPDNEPPLGPPVWPPAPMPAHRRSNTLVLFHNGHCQPCTLKGCDADHDGSIDWFNQLGYDVMAFQMPLFQCNSIAESQGVRCSHAWFEQFEPQIPTIRFFIEPVILSINYAKTLGYTRFIMAGLSGGGWTTTVAAAVDTRISLSMPIAGSMPCDFAHTSWDYEQFCDRPYLLVANYTSMYVLAALESDRYSVQIIHEHDNCCFHGCNRHGRIKLYNEWVQSQIAGQFATVPTVGNMHEVNPRDKMVVGNMLEKLRVRGALGKEDFKNIPFSTLNEWGP